MSNKKIFAEVNDVEAAFYQALENADLNAMMAVWAEDEEIVCVHPGGPRLIGYAAVRDAWRRVFEGGHRLMVETSVPSVVATPFAVMHSLIERIRLRDNKETTAPLSVTNVYVRGAMGWRMVAHHASPVPPESLVETPKVLH